MAERKIQEIVKHLSKSISSGVIPGAKEFSNKEKFAILFYALRQNSILSLVNVGWFVHSFPLDELSDNQAIRLCKIFSSRGFHNEICVILERFTARKNRKRKKVINSRVIIPFAKKAFKDGAFKPGAQMLIWFGYWKNRSISIDDILWEIDKCILTKRGDHGLHRLFAILLNRLKCKYGTKIPDKIHRKLATNISDVATAWKDMVDVQIMVRGLREIFPKSAEEIINLADKINRSKKRRLTVSWKQAVSK